MTKFSPFQSVATYILWHSYIERGQPETGIIKNGMNIDNKIQQTFNGPLIFMGITFAVTAIALVFGSLWYLGILSFIIALFLLFTFSGMEINTKKE